MTLSTATQIATIVSAIATVAFGVWSVCKGARPRSGKVMTLVFLLVFICAAQMGSTKWLGHPIISENMFSSLVFMLILVIWWTIRDEPDSR